MTNREYFQTTSLSYRLRAAERELASFRSGEAYVKLRTDYEKIIRDRDLTIKRLQKERDDFSFSRKEITRQWMEVLEDLQKEQEGEVKKLKKVITELLDIVASLKNRNTELDEKGKKPCVISMKQRQSLRMRWGLLRSSLHRSTIIMKIHPCLRPSASAVKKSQTTGKRPGRSQAPSRATRTIPANL